MTFTVKWRTLTQEPWLYFQFHKDIYSFESAPLVNISLRKDLCYPEVNFLFFSTIFQQIRLMNCSLINCLSYHFLIEAAECLIIQGRRGKTFRNITMNIGKGELEISVESSSELRIHTFITLSPPGYLLYAPCLPMTSSCLPFSEFSIQQPELPS